MIDRELLELAAKAVGIEYIPGECEKSKEAELRFGFWLKFPDGIEVPDGIRRRWNPLLDDGDALRLAVELGMRVEIDLECEEVCIYIYPQGGKRVSACENFDVSKDRFAATRRAIVLASAKIGKEM